MNKLTIIIAHYDPGNSNKSKQSFIKTLESIKQQISNYNLEIIIADDGSYYTSSLELPTDKSKSFYQLTNKQIDKILFDFYGDKENSKIITKWIFLPKKENKMYKPRVLNKAVSLSSGNMIFFLDDDNYFINNKSIENIYKLFNSYEIIFGQVVDNNGRNRKYSSSRVQGTTFGMYKEIFSEIDGFGEWTIEMSNGVDSDIWWKLFQYSKKNQIRGCYTSSIQTLDSCSKRWRTFTPRLFRKMKLKNKFNDIYGCKNYRSKIYNPSRNKSLWLDDLT